MKTHTTHVCNIISKYNGIIRKVKQFLPSDSLPTLFNDTLLYPYINYCAIIWADNNNSHRDSILLLRKRIVRTCTNTMWLENANPLFQSLNTLTIHNLYSLQVGIFMYQFHHNLFPDDLLEPNYFTMNNEVHNYNTRGATNIRVGRPCQPRGGYSTLGWVRMCGPKFRPPPYNKTRGDANLQPITKPFAS